MATLDNSICKILTNSLVTQFSVLSRVTGKFLLEVVEQWGKLHCLEGEDIMHAHDTVLFPNTRTVEMHLSFVCMT